MGTRTISDLIAPYSVRVEHDHLRIDGQCARTLVLTGYPRLVVPGWLNPLLQELGEPVELSLHLHPLETARMVPALTRKLNQFQSSRNASSREGMPDDSERETAYEDTEGVRDRLQRGVTKLFSVSLYLLLRAPTIARLDELTRRVEGILASMMAQSRAAWWEHDSGFHACLPEGDDRLRVWRNLDTASLATTFPFTSSSLSTGSGVLYGTALHNRTLVIVDPFDDTRLHSANGVVLAPTGAGKSFWVKVTSLRNMLLGTDVFVIDPEGEYRGLCEAVGGQYVRLGAGSSQHLNPLDVPAPPEDPSEEGAGFVDHIERLIGWLEIALCARGEKLSPHERSVLDRALHEAYGARGITADPGTHLNVPPRLSDLAAVLLTRPGEVPESLAARLERYTELSLSGMFNHPTNVDADARFVAFDVFHVGPDLLPLAVHTISNFVWGQLCRRRRQRLLVIDETHVLLRHQEGGEFLADLARRCRKRGMGLVAITQQIKDFLASEHGLALLDQSSYQLLMRQRPGGIDTVAGTFNLSAGERQFLLSAERGEGLFCAMGSRVPIYLEASPMEYRLATTAPRDLEARRAPSSGEALLTLVEGAAHDRRYPALQR